MARYKVIDRSPRFLPVVLDAQLMPGSFEYALDYLVDNELDLSRLDERYIYMGSDSINQYYAAPCLFGLPFGNGTALRSVMRSIFD